jgi:hypothetical protein
MNTSATVPSPCWPRSTCAPGRWPPPPPRAHPGSTRSFFSIIQKKVLTPNDFASTGELSQTLLAFADRYNLTARPFNWKFSVHDLTALLRRISQREPGPPGQQADLSQAA